jgi:hypothetical protein
VLPPLEVELDVELDVDVGAAALGVLAAEDSDLDVDVADVAGCASTLPLVLAASELGEDLSAAASLLAAGADFLSPSRKSVTYQPEPLS